MKKRFYSKAGELEVTRAIIKSFLDQLYNYAESDVIIVGAGPAGLMAGKELAKESVKVLIIERNNYLGGGFWMGGYLMNKVTLRSPSERILQDIGVSCEEYEKDLWVVDGPYACSKLIAAAYDAGIKVLNMTMFDDLVLRGDKVVGVVINWSCISALPREVRCIDPIALESKIVIDCTGHDAYVVKNLEQRGLAKVKGCGAMWIEESEDAVVENTVEIVPGVIVAGMSVSAVFGLPRMGPTFGSMLLSGEKAAKIAIKRLKSLS